MKNVIHQGDPVRCNCCGMTTIAGCCHWRRCNATSRLPATANRTRLFINNNVAGAGDLTHSKTGVILWLSPLICG